MEYNTTRSKLLMPEYGRNVQKMIEYLLTLDDREKRLRNAEVIIELMGTLNPHLKTIEDYKHKLWDHLYQMTDFKLDVDSPYPAPTAEEVFRKPERLPYPQGPIRHRHLGKNLQALLDRATNETDEVKRVGLTQAVGYYMKLAYGNWHKEPVHDDMIKNELSEITGGKLRYEPGNVRIPYDNQRPNFKQRNNQNNNNNNNRNFKNNPNVNTNNNNNNQRNTNFNNAQAQNTSGIGTTVNNNGYNKNRKYKKK
jgi:Domain of unknown function (DUF4290)